LDGFFQAHRRTSCPRRFPSASVTDFQAGSKQRLIELGLFRLMQGALISCEMRCGATSFSATFRVSLSQARQGGAFQCSAPYHAVPQTRKDFQRFAAVLRVQQMVSLLTVNVGQIC